MEVYGSDKPDLRIDLTVQDVTALMDGCGFGPFEGQVVKAVAVSDMTATRKQIDKLCAEVEVVSGSKAYWFKMDEKGELAGGIAKFLQERKDEVIAALNLKPNTMRLIVNRAPNGVLSEGVKEEIAAQKLDLLGVLPQDEAVYEADCDGRPSSKLPDSSPMKQALHGLLKQLPL